MARRNSICIFTDKFLPRREPVIVEDERSWRHCQKLFDENRNARMAIGRWYQQVSTLSEVRAPILPDHFTIDVLVRRAIVKCHKDGRLIYSGSTDFGAVQITSPGTEIRCLFSSPSEAVHIFVPRNMVAQVYEDIAERSLPVDFELFDPCFATHAAIGSLVHVLLEADQFSESCGALWSESLIVALLARIFASHPGLIGGGRMSTGGLSPFRQRRVVDYIENNLSEKISLSDLATQAGLSRMHFASQFKRANGMTPHAFVMHRRVERAKELLRKNKLSIMEIAFDAGFRSQAHFTVVFRRFAGTTPTAWRGEHQPAA